LNNAPKADLNTGSNQNVEMITMFVRKLHGDNKKVIFERKNISFLELTMFLVHLLLIKIYPG